jgi:alkylation response protein AidB-like acyl-CoA dehydrogenase
LDGIVTIPFNQPMTRPDVPADEDLGARFRPLFQRIAGEAVRREQQRELPFEAVQWLREAGFGAIRVPKAYGTAPREAWFAKQPAAVITRAPISEPVDELAGG